MRPLAVPEADLIRRLYATSQTTVGQLSYNSGPRVLHRAAARDARKGVGHS
jgi:hypothetical protein